MTRQNTLKVGFNRRQVDGEEEVVGVGGAVEDEEEAGEEEVVVECSVPRWSDSPTVCILSPPPC